MPCPTRRLPELLLAGALALTACNSPDPAGAGASDAPSAAPAAPAAPAYATELARVDGALAAARQSVAQDAAFWPGHERVARLLLERAALTGRFDDYAEAAATVDLMARGPRLALCPTGIRVHLAVHRLAAARALLDECGRGNGPGTPPAELLSLQADLAMQQGDLAQARRLAQGVLATRETPQDLARLARYYELTGAPAEALALLDRAEKIDHAATPVLRAWLALRRGLVALHRGRWEEALAHDLAAERWLAGWWLVEEHVAEVRALLGQTAAAVTAYERLLAQEPRPELMDALARLHLAHGRPDAAQALIAEARAQYRGRLERLPEAAGHALAHDLAFAPATPATLALARRAAQAGGAARLDLARALIAAQRWGDARAEIAALRATSWRTAELHAVAHEAFRRAGDPAAAAREAQAAAAMNPHWREQYLPGG